MTAFEDLERGDIVWAADPLSEEGRPMLVLGTPERDLPMRVFRAPTMGAGAPS